MLPSVAWLLKIETDSILIKEKRKHLSKMFDRVSKKMKRKLSLIHISEPTRLGMKGFRNCIHNNSFSSYLKHKPSKLECYTTPRKKCCQK